MQKLVWQNSLGDEVDLTKAPYGITNWEGFSNTSLNIQSQQVPFQDGGVFLDALMEQRELSVTLAIQDNNNLENRYKYRRELIHILNPKLGEGYLIYTNDFISKRIKCIPQIPLFETHNSNDSGTPKASLAWTACNPYWEDVEANNVILKQNVIQPIINEGETETELEVDLFISNCVNPKIQNLTTGKQIEINGTFDNNVNINLNFGKKTVSLSKMTYKYNTLENVGKIYYSEAFKLYVIISDGENIFTSKDGVDWKLIGSGELFSDVVIGNDFIFIPNYDNQNYNYKTTNGEDWEIVTTTVALNKICYSKTLNKYYATTRTGIYSSSNLVDWTNVYQSSEFTIVVDICCSESVIIATKSSRGIVVSSDGENWNEIESDVYATDVIYVEETRKFYMAGSVQVGGSSVSITSYSSDGVNWERTLWDFYIQLYSITFFDGAGTFYISAGSSESYSIYKSKDFVKWNLENSFGNIKNIFGISVANHRVFVSYEKDTDLKLLLYSFDGNSWNNFINTYEIVKFVYSKKLGIYCGYDDNAGWGITAHIYYSYDGISWYVARNVGSYFGIQDICYSEKIGKFFLTVDGNIYISSDGINWTEQEVDIGEVGLLCSSEKLGIVLCCGDSDSYFITTDGESWTEYEGYNFSNICYSEKLGLFCAISYDTSIIKISNNGINWQDINTDYNFSSDSMCVSENLGLFVIATTDLIVSSDGITWTPVLYNIPSSYSSKLITYSEELGLFCFIEGDVNVMISSDGINWTDKLTLTSIARSVFSITNKGAFRILTHIGAIVTSIETITNIISDIDKSSDMTLDLIVGKNDLLLTQESGSVSGRVVYRQKYIGV